MDTIYLPRLAGARGTAVDVAAAAPVGSELLEVRASDAEAASQGFCDELVGQLLSERHVGRIRLVDPTPTMLRHFTDSMGRRDAAERLDIDYRLRTAPQTT